MDNQKDWTIQAGYKCTVRADQNQYLYDPPTSAAGGRTCGKSHPRNRAEEIERAKERNKV
jgi:hypothetical protein